MASFASEYERAATANGSSGELAVEVEHDQAAAAGLVEVAAHRRPARRRTSAPTPSTRRRRGVRRSRARSPGRRRCARSRRRGSRGGRGPSTPAPACARRPRLRQAKASSSQRRPSTTMPVSQCGQAAPPAIISAVSASSLATAQSSAALRLSCSWSIAVSHARCWSPVNAAALCEHSRAKCAAIASRMRTASPRSVSRSRPYWASVCSWVNRSPPPAGTATTSDLSTRAWRWSATSAAAMVSSAHTASAVAEVATAGEHGEPFEDALLVVEEQLVAPVDDGAQRLLARQGGARARRSAGGTDR